MINRSSVIIQHARAGHDGGGFAANQDVVIAGMSNVNISNSQAVFGHGGGFALRRGLQVTGRSAIFISNTTAGGSGGGAYAGGHVVINSSTVSIQHARAGTVGAGFAIDGGLEVHSGWMFVRDSTTTRVGSGGFMKGRALLTSQSQFVVRDVEGNDSSAVLVADCLHIHPGSAFLMENVKGGHAVKLQNSGCSSECSNRTLQMETGAALNTTGHCPLSLGLLSVAACPNETVHLSGIHLRSWSSPLLSPQPNHVVIDDVSIHYEPPLKNLPILTAKDCRSTLTFGLQRLFNHIEQHRIHPRLRNA